MIEQIISLIAEQLNIPEEKIKPESRIVEDLGADSLDIVELLMSFEEEFGVTVSDEKAQEMATIADIEKVILEIQK